MKTSPVVRYLALRRTLLSSRSLVCLLALLVAVFGSAPECWSQASHVRPNILVILADDLGYGDLSSYGATKVKTPNIDRLAQEGMRFTDAYSPHSVCTPTRYGLMTGRYAWRSWIGHSVISPDDPLLIDTKQLTLPKVLKSAGYRTAVIGKWHLGFGAPETPGWDDMKGPDYNRELKPGPLEVGFDYFFGVPHVGQPPYILIENHRVLGLDPADPVTLVLDKKWEKRKRTYFDRVSRGQYALVGTAESYQHENLAITLTARAVNWIEEQTQPFFLYFPHRSPHGPHIPHSRFNGASAIGPYGDSIQELDWSVGEVLAALDRKGVAKNTIVIFASDNGGVVNYFPSSVADVGGHHVNGPLFGQKSEVFEGGTRVPFIVRWPETVKAGATSEFMVALTDVLATVADVVGIKVPYDAGEDSFSFLHQLRGTKPTAPVRTNLVMDSYAGTFAIREGPWKLIAGSGGGGVAVLSEPSEFGGQLYDLSHDIGETTNLFAEQPKIASRLNGLLRKIQYSGRSR